MIVDIGIHVACYIVAVLIGLVRCKIVIRSTYGPRRRS